MYVNYISIKLEEKDKVEVLEDKWWMEFELRPFHSESLEPIKPLCGYFGIWQNIYIVSLD